jgi:hypothetical protein
MILFVLILNLFSPVTKADAIPKVSTCTQKQKNATKKHITEQINALSRSDWEGAYGYAAKSFKISISLELFKEIINRQYAFLINHDGIGFGNCKTNGVSYNQIVNIDDNGSVRTLSYDLIMNRNRLGVLAANEIETPIRTVV